MKSHGISYLIIFMSALFFSACSGKRKADLTGIDFDITIERFDSAFWTLDTTQIETSFKNLSLRYPSFSQTYLHDVVRFGAPDDPQTHMIYKKFRNDTAVQRLYNDELSCYSNISDIEQELTDAFRRAKYFFPDLATPKVYAHASGLNTNVILGNDFLSVSLDNYLGKDYVIYSLIGIYEYQRQNMTRENITSDCILTWLINSFPYIRPEFSLLEDMIYRGKIVYTASLLLPEADENILLGYTAEQLKWMENNEAELWKLIIDNKVLYETDALIKGSYLNDGPFTLPFSRESPGRGGVFFGYKIVESYMKHNRTITPLQLILQNDAQIILTKSKYRP